MRFNSDALNSIAKGGIRGLYLP